MSDDNETISTSQQDNPFQFDEKQLEAINAACDVNNRVVIISGNAGTGKTTIQKAIYQRLSEAGYTISLSAPTGKAAKRIYEATKIPAMTNHRLLEYTHPGETDPETGKPFGIAIPRRDRENQLEFDVLMCDEYAMVNWEIHNNLLAAMKAGARIIMFGDDRQLAPIEEDDWKDRDKPKKASPFVTCLNEPRLKSVKLTKVFRQADGSGLLDNLHLILRQSVPKNNDQWFNKFSTQPIKALENYIMEHWEDIPFNIPENQIIVPGNSKFIGTRKLNFILQALYFDPAEDREDENGEGINFIRIPRHNWEYGMYDTKGAEGGYIKLHEGDKVIYTANNLDLQVFNGETGVIKSFDREFGEVVIDFGDREQSIPIIMLKMNQYGNMVEFDPRKDISLAYCVTTHKMQGSQVKHVVYVMNKCDAWLLNNRNMYTACSRATDYVYLITDQESFTRTIHRRD